MAKISQLHKDALICKGEWSNFVTYRTSLIMNDELDPAAANVEAVRKFLGDEAAEKAGESGSKKKAVDEPVVRFMDEEKRPVVVPNEDPEFIGSVPAPPPPVKKALFKDKPDEADERVNIKWVADNMRIVDIRPKECPSKRAWNMLCECRENKMFRATFWHTHYAKIVPTKADVDAGRKARIDGQPTIDMIQRILKAKEKAEKGGVG